MSQFVVGLGEVLWDMFPKGKRLGGAPAHCRNDLSVQRLPGTSLHQTA